MAFLGNLFGAGGRDRAPSPPADTAWRFYVKSRHADEIIEVRIDPRHDLTEEFEGEGESVSHYSARKDAMGTKSFKMIRLHLIFDTDRQFTGDATVEGGSLVDKATYEAWKAAQGAA
ncbi:MAG: hypothetical protein FJ029_10535 [Actinobacteria bacterium]|nr:hypothetical protein [Actinomycetota bacterium]